MLFKFSWDEDWEYLKNINRFIFMAFEAQTYIAFQR
jgi:hypothetical protein